MKTPVLIACLLLAPRAFAAEPEIREFSVTLDKPEARYTVEVGGTIDPENVEIVIENVGETAVADPRMTVNGRYDWHDVDAIVREATEGCRTDEEKVMGIFNWVLYKRFQRSPRDASAIHPVRAMNGYGYGICGHTSAWMKCLLTAAGIKARVHELWGHTISEAYWDGAWHMLDANVKVFYPGRDNRTMASLADLERDKGLIERNIHPRDPWVRRPEPKWRTDEFVRYIVTDKDNYEEETYDREIAKGYTMAMTLRPGEKLLRWWTPRLGKSDRSDGPAPERYANGRLVWEPDLARVDIRPFLSVPQWGNVDTAPGSGKEPAIRVADLQNKTYTRPAVFTIPVSSAYPIVGGRLQATLVKQGSSERDLVSIFFGAPGWRPGDLLHAPREARAGEVDLTLDAPIRKDGVRYSYGIGFAISGNADANPPTQSGVQSFRLTSDLQVSPHSVPALSRGTNTVHFRQASGGKVRITHRWREIHDRHAPRPVEAPLAPAKGGESASLAPVLKWQAASDADASDTIADYQVMVSLRPDCRWPVAPVLHQSLGSPATEWAVPAGFLNPDTTYYWRVRARDSRGDIGEWSQPFSFRTSRGAK